MVFKIKFGEKSPRIKHVDETIISSDGIQEVWWYYLQLQRSGSLVERVTTPSNLNPMQISIWNVVEIDAIKS